ncbi:MAG TPA: hypothetical protein VFC17_06290 [Candidatus Limnocylindrales bacterium]|nr:hypothetical protein [Candidatus Limnocylindrales bacterium]
MRHARKTVLSDDRLYFETAVVRAVRPAIFETHQRRDGKPWRIGTEAYGDRDILPRDVISRKLSVPNAERTFFIRHALRASFTIEEIFNLTKIDRWFLVQIKEIVDFEEELATSGDKG